jgi:hypothetical protein
VKTQPKPSLGIAINGALDAGDESVRVLEDANEPEAAAKLRDAVKAARAALKAAQPPRDAKADAKAKEAQDDRDLDEMLARGR